MRALVAPLEMKGALTAREIADTLSDALASLGWEVDCCPLSDGGPGLIDALATPGERRRVRVHDARGREVEATWAHLSSGAGLVEMAQAAGLARLPLDLRNPRVTTTVGVGELIAAALDEGCSTLAVGAGGSATNDGGTGALSALGIRFLDAGSELLPPGGAALNRLARIDSAGLDPRVRTVDLQVLSDVDSPLLGPSGATALFSAQKGADESARRELEAGLARLASVMRATTGVDVSDRPGMGAAGGLAYGLAAFGGARVTSGFEWIAARTHLVKRIQRADVVLTAEGRLDAQSLRGKGTVRLTELARAEGKPCVAWVGRCALVSARVPFAEVVEISPDLSPDGISTERDEIIRRLAAAVTAWASTRRA